jgi:carboxylesterase
VILPDRTPFSTDKYLPFTIGSGATGVLLLHGYLGTPAEVRGIAESLSRNGTTNHGILLPGFGKDIANLGSVTQINWLSTAETAWQSISSRHPRRVIVGYSMGGAVAIQLAVKHSPDALVLIAPFWKAPGVLAPLVSVFKHIIRVIRPFQFVDFENEEIRSYFEGMYPNMDLENPANQKFARENFVIPLASVDEVLRLGKSAYEAAARISVPILIIQGQQDMIVRPSNTKSLVRQIPACQVEYAEIPGAHDLISEESENHHLVVDLIQEFIEVNAGE